MTTLPPLQTTSIDSSGGGSRFKEVDSIRNDGTVKHISSSDINTIAKNSNDHAVNNHITTKEENVGFNDSSISSPHELTDWVDNVLDQLESRFSVMSGQVESRSE